MVNEHITSPIRVCVVHSVRNKELVVYLSEQKLVGCTCADPEVFVRGGPPFFQQTVLFVFDEGIEDPNINISGPSSARQQNAILMALRWRADDGPTLNAGFVAL